MKTYQVLVTETLQGLVSIQARDDAEAVEKVRELYKNEKIILTADDHIDTDITCQSFSN